jgi:arylsulfatase A-like enzyme
MAERAIVICAGFMMHLVVAMPLNAQSSERPNIVFIMADDLGYGDLGCYGQRVIQTPRLDRMAQEGLRFTQFYAGNTVCAPSRCVLMTGMHMGHAQVRGNAGSKQLDRQSLRDSDITVAEVLKERGYYNGLVGKWGLGELGLEGHPLRQGFDFFYGYLNQVHAHNYFPEYLWRNASQEKLRNVVQGTGQRDPHFDFTPGAASVRIDYTPDLFAQEALSFITAHQQEPFFLYLAVTAPHANNEGTRLTGDGAEVLDYGQYGGEAWPNPDKGQAALVSQLDSHVGELLDHLHTLGIAEKTLVFFTSDNGPHNESNHHLDRFHPSGTLRGIKRSLYEGGIRVPAIAWMPGTVVAGGVTDHIAYAGDFLATAAEFAGTTPPPHTDSVSFLPTLIGESSKQAQHDYLYWEFYEQGSRQAVRFGRWKAIREPMLTGDVELFDLEMDLSESRNVAEDHPDEVAQAVQWMDQAYEPHPNWLVPGKK